MDESCQGLHSLLREPCFQNPVELRGRRGELQCVASADQPVHPSQSVSGSNLCGARTGRAEKPLESASHTDSQPDAAREKVCNERTHQRHPQMLQLGAARSCGRCHCLPELLLHAGRCHCLPGGATVCQEVPLFAGRCHCLPGGATVCREVPVLVLLPVTSALASRSASRDVAAHVAAHDAV